MWKNVLVSKMLQLKNRKINATGPVLPWKSPHNCLVGSLGGCTMLLTITVYVEKARKRPTVRSRLLLAVGMNGGNSGKAGIA
jgi:hypothetical protein